MQIVKNNGLGSSAQDIIANGGVAAGLMTRQVFENSISAIVNSEVVDITTNGGTAIQQSIFGFVGHDRSEIAKDGQKYRCYNGGQELKWVAEKNSVEILLTMNFFKSVIPEKEQTSYEHMRQWLIDHDVIKGIKTDGTKSDPTPFGIGYRIPTQGMSSMFSFTVADVLPEQVGDLIVVPREFTAQTGSDKQY